MHYLDCLIDPKGEPTQIHLKQQQKKRHFVG